MAVKVKKVKWAVSGTEPEDLAEFKDNDQIVKENKGLPAKGVYTLAVKRMYVKPNKNEDDRVSAMLIFKEPKKSKSVGYNGYLVRDGFNITEQGTPFLKRFLKGLGLTWDDFYNKSKEQEDGDRRELVQIGRIKFGSAANEDPTVRALLKESPADDWNDEPYMEVVRYLPADDDEPEEDDDAADMDDADDDGVEVEPDAEEPAEPEDDRPTFDDVMAMKPKALIEVLQEQGVKQKKIDKMGKDKAALQEAALIALGHPPF